MRKQLHTMAQALRAVVRTSTVPGPARHQIRNARRRARLDALEEAVQVRGQALAHAAQRAVVGEPQLVQQAALAEEGHPGRQPAVRLRGAADCVVHSEAEAARRRVRVLAPAGSYFLVW
jgi:hypothetical protein